MPHIEDAMKLFLEHRRLRGLAIGSLELYKRWLCFWRDWREKHQHPPDIHTVTIAEFRQFFLYLAEEHIPHGKNNQRPAAQKPGVAPATLLSVWTLLRAFWRFCEMEELLVPTQLQYFRNDRLPRPRVEEQIRPIYEQDLINLLLATCQLAKTEEEELRNQALLLMLLESGARVSEICNLCDHDIDIRKKQAKIRGKGGRYRHIFWSERTQGALARYVPVRRGEIGGPLFRGCSSTNDGGHLTANAVRGMLRRLAKKAGVELHYGSPIHAIRHTFAHMALESGLDGLHLQQLLGHSSIETTQRYVREHPDSLRKIHGKIFERRWYHEFDKEEPDS